MDFLISLIIFLIEYIFFVIIGKMVIFYCFNRFFVYFIFNQLKKINGIFFIIKGGLKQELYYCFLRYVCYILVIKLFIILMEG